MIMSGVMNTLEDFLIEHGRFMDEPERGYGRFIQKTLALYPLWNGTFGFSQVPSYNSRSDNHFFHSFLATTLSVLNYFNGTIEPYIPPQPVLRKSPASFTQP
jgi:hypothetical protein